MDRQEHLSTAIASVGVVASAIFYGLRPFDAPSLGYGSPCANLLYVQGCRGVAGSIFAGDPCGAYARHRLPLLVGLIGLSIVAGIILRLATRGRSLIALLRAQGSRISIPAAVLGVATGLWSWGYFDKCNDFMPRWQAAIAGFGVGLTASFVGGKLRRHGSEGTSGLSSSVWT
jgi:hypothetical protein